MWHKTPGDKVTWNEAIADADTFSLAGYDDWRLPTIKELYSLIDFSGIDPSGYNGSDTSGLVPFIDTDYFDFEYGDTSAGERVIAAQYWSRTEYVGTTMNGDATTFGVNFADGRIKGYGREHQGGAEMTQFVRYVRGNMDYGVNNFADNGDGTITDSATGLMWSQTDSGAGMTWEAALAWVQQKDAENYLGHDDWRLPDAKELQSIVDYARSPSTTDVSQSSLPGDVNGDCVVNIMDIMLVAARWRACDGDANYDPLYDLDQDGDIDIVDVMEVATHWGATCG